MGFSILKDFVESTMVGFIITTTGVRAELAAAAKTRRFDVELG